MKFTESPEFQAELKKLKKKYQTLSDDIEVLKKSLTANPSGDGSKHWHIRHEDTKLGLYALKVRMMCRDVRGAQFRVAYIYEEAKIEILFIEIYFKGQKENEDRERLHDYFEQQKKSLEAR